MGQKVNPNGIRLGIVKPWNSTWFANTQDFADNLDGDFKVRKFLTKELANASVSRITIERPAKSIRVTIHTARPGIAVSYTHLDVYKRQHFSYLATLAFVFTGKYDYFIVLTNFCSHFSLLLTVLLVPKK